MTGNVRYQFVVFDPPYEHSNQRVLFDQVFLSVRPKVFSLWLALFLEILCYLPFCRVSQWSCHEMEPQPIA